MDLSVQHLGLIEGFKRILGTGRQGNLISLKITHIFLHILLFFFPSSMGFKPSLWEEMQKSLLGVRTQINPLQFCNPEWLSWIHVCLGLCITHSWGIPLHTAASLQLSVLKVFSSLGDSGIHCCLTLPDCSVPSSLGSWFFFSWSHENDLLTMESLAQWVK